MSPKRSRCSVVGCNNEHSSHYLLQTSEPLKTQRITFVCEGNAPSIYLNASMFTQIICYPASSPEEICKSFFGNFVFRCESESTLFVFPKEDTTRNQWLSCIHNTVPEQFNPNIVCAECVQSFLQRTVSWTWKSNVTLQCWLHKDCFYKVEQIQLRKNSLVFLTHSL